MDLSPMVNNFLLLEVVILENLSRCCQEDRKKLEGFSYVSRSKAALINFCV